MCSEYSRFFGGPEGSVPEYTQPQFAEVLSKIFSDGVFPDIDNELEVVETDPVDLAVRVNTGEAWIGGYWYQNTAYLTKSLGAADPTNSRIDRIVLRLDTTTNFKISAEVLTGTPAGSPAAPALTQTSSIYEISLAQVLVGNGATSVNNSKITDERTYAAVSGLDSYATLATAQTLTNKRITKRVGTSASAATHTINSDNYDVFTVTAQAEAVTFAAPSGTPTQGQTLLIRIKDNGTARGITWNGIFRDGTDIAKPTTTVISKTLYVGFVYNSTDSKWDLIFVVDGI